MSVDIKKLKAYQTLPTIKSSDSQWIEWADGTISKYGSDKGAQLVLKAWQKRGSRDANTHALRQAFLKHGLEVDSSAWDKIVDVGHGIGKSFGKIFTAGKWTVIIGVVVLGAVVIGVGVNAIKTGSLPLKGLKK